MNKFYITTAIVYTNAPPHIGWALELLQADVLARYHRQMGQDTWFLTGTDEHGTKIARAAREAGMEPEVFADVVSGKARELTKALSISNDDFIRTSDRERHWPAVTKFWRKLRENGDLYKKEYEGLYCVGHEAFIRRTELVDGRCPVHKSELEPVKEENWFFKLTKYKDAVKAKIQSGELNIVPASRKGEILNILEDAEDVSFSRPAESLKWGIPVPDDPTQTIYVWADALTNYISAIGYENETEQFRKYWPADVHLIGKDILRFHALFWPAMLLAAGLELPKAVYVHGFITVGGEKMSKSLGNVIDPLELIKGYGSEVVRYFLLRELPSGDDGDFSYKNLASRYNSDLANGLGNLLQRTVTLIDSLPGGAVTYRAQWDKGQVTLQKVREDSEYHEAVAQFRLHDALADIWAKIALLNAYINEREPWKQAGEDRQETLGVAATGIAHIAWLLQPFLPDTAEKIAAVLGVPLAEWPDGQLIRIVKGEPLFPRRD